MSIDTTRYFEAVQQAASSLRERGAGDASVAIVLGSGLGDFADGFKGATTIPYADIPNWPGTTVIGHAGRLVAGAHKGRKVIALSGRAHYYEGHSMQTVTFATRVMATLGVKTLILTNAAGGINRDLTPGTLMLISDHINLMGGNPLMGPNEDRFGPRFPDMTALYSPRLCELARQAANGLDLRLGEGVYVALHGPSYETPAEIRFLRTIGADAVGMSTAPEAIVARHMGMEVLGISCITNAAAGVLPQPLDHNEVMEVAKRVRAQFSALLEGILERL